MLKKKIALPMITEIERQMGIVRSAYIATTYVISLCGPEGLLLYLQGLCKHWFNDNCDYIVIALFGKLKGENFDVNHLIPCINITTSKINVRKCIQRLIVDKQRFGFKDGPAISNHEGKMLSLRDLDDMLHDLLKDNFSDNKSLFPSDILSEDDIPKFYQSFCTWRRSSYSRAIEKKSLQLI
mmetsp:Transcript_1310/g.1887  ORF Transcript_1310/g.1887 Transcript_1310/m.1887 type:complete len:182 (+) Transcript_1310:3104-3649(+)